MYIKNNIFEVETLPTQQLAPWGEGKWGWGKRGEGQGGWGICKVTVAPTPLAFFPFPPPPLAFPPGGKLPCWQGFHFKDIVFYIHRIYIEG